MQTRKRFGQHFLTDASVLARTLDCIGPRPTDRLLEIGPGRGALTELLHGTAERFVAIEIDRDLGPMLRARFPGLELVVADVLKFEFTELGTDAPWRIAGNLPYNISTPLLVRLLTSNLPIEDMHFMLQKELADRVYGEPGTKAWGRLSVLVQYHCTVEMLFDVEPSELRAAAESAIVDGAPDAARRDPPPLTYIRRDFDTVLRTAFSARRKRLANALKSLPVDWDRAAVDTSSRADQLSVCDYVRIANAVQDPVSAKGTVG